MENGQPLAHHTRRHLIDPVGAVEHGEIGPLHPAGGRVGQRRQVLHDAVGSDQFLVAVPERGGAGGVGVGLRLSQGPFGVRVAVGLELRPVTGGLGERALPVRLGVRRTPDLRLQPLCGQPGLPLGQSRLLLDDLLRRPGLGQRSGLGGAGVVLLGLGEEATRLIAVSRSYSALSAAACCSRSAASWSALAWAIRAWLATAAACGAARLLM